MCHPFFDELRTGDQMMASGKSMPPLFDFTKEELSVKPDAIHHLVPESARSSLLDRGIDVNNFEPLSAEQSVLAAASNTALLVLADLASPCCSLALLLCRMRISLD